MSPFQFPEVPYTIEKIMDAIREQIVDAPPENDASPEPDPAQAPTPPPRPLIDTGVPLSQLAAQVDLLRQRQSLDSGYRVRSHRPVLGFFVDLVKRVIHWGSKPYADSIRSRQESFNDAAVQAMREMMLELERVRGELVNQRQDASRQNDEASRQREEAGKKLYQELEALGERLTKLINDSIQRSTRYQEWLVNEKQKHLEGLISQAGDRLDALESSTDAIVSRHDLGPFFSQVPEERRLATMDITRGTRDDISGRQAFYVDLLAGAPGQVLDVGCGRGELLTQLRHRGIECWGNEIDPMLVRMGRERGIHVVQTDALSALRMASARSLGAIFAAQVVEHLFPGELLQFLQLARERLAPGGLIVLETLNPAALGVLSKSYYRDIDHKQPLHPEYLKLLVDLAGFEAVELHYLAPFQESERLADLPEAEGLGLSGAAREALQDRFDQLNRILYGMQDYYIVGRQPAADSATGRTQGQDHTTT